MICTATSVYKYSSAEVAAQGLLQDKAIPTGRERFGHEKARWNRNCGKAATISVLSKIKPQHLMMSAFVRQINPLLRRKDALRLGEAQFDAFICAFKERPQQ